MISSILNSELYDFGVIAIFENILPVCDVLDLFHLDIKQPKIDNEKLWNDLFYSLTSSVCINRLEFHCL